MPRPLSFNPDEKLDEAMRLFWQHGYQDLSINDLSSQLSLNKFSLYKQFGSKDELFLEALRHYQVKIYRHLLRPLDENEGLTSIEAYFENFSVQVSKRGAGAGCFINNTLLAGDSMPKDCRTAAIEMVSELRSKLKTNFKLAAQHGEISASVTECLNFTLMTIQALLNTRRTLGPLVMQANLKFFVKQMRKW